MGWDESFEEFPILETKRFRLRKIELTDASNMFSYFSQERVTEFYDLETFSSEQQAVELIESLLFRYQSRKQIRWGITTKESNELIGTCGFHALEKEHFKAEIGYELHPKNWGSGVMTEVIAKVVDFGFNEMGLNRIEAYYDPLNHASRRVLEKNGFKLEGILRKRFFEKGRFVDAAISGLLKENK